METVQVENGYDRTKHPELITLRKCTMEDLHAMAQGKYYPTFKALDRAGKVRDIRRNGAMKTWKRDATRFEQSFKYGMYETFRWNTQEMLDQLYFPV